MEKRKKTSLRWVKVESSNIDMVTHFKKTNTLRIVFKKDGSIYDYSPVKSVEFKDLINAESVGKHFIDNIRDKEGIICTKIEQ